MKTLFSISISLILTLVCFGQSANSPSRTSPTKSKIPFDTELNGLKGKVKKIITEEAELKKQGKKFVEAKRKPLEIAEFDADGYYTQKIIYSIGDKNIYQFIDGDKTVNFEKFDSPYAKGITITAIAPDNGKPQKPWDPRYDHRYVYKFDEAGRVKEEITYLGNGEYWQKEVYSYNDKGIRIKTAYYGNNEELDWEEIYKIDSNGMVLEQLSNVLDTEGSTITTYTDYQFDENGNWTKRIESDVVIKKGKRIVTPSKMVYRTITYYKN